nr:hypothetical protein [Tanacetum cinerariifolium]
MEEEVGAIEKILMLLEYLEHQMHPLEEVEEVAVAVETQKEFLRIIQLLVIFMSFIGFILKHSLLENFLHINDRQITETSLKWSLHLPVYCIGGGGGIVVVFMTVEVVADEVGSGEPDCKVVRSITKVVNGGTEEIEDRVPVELAGSSGITRSLDGNL